MKNPKQSFVQAVYTDYDYNRDEHTPLIPIYRPNNSYTGQTSMGYYARAGDTEIPDINEGVPRGNSTGLSEEEEPYAGTASDPIQFNTEVVTHST